MENETCLYDKYAYCVISFIDNCWHSECSWYLFTISPNVKIEGA